MVKNIPQKIKNLEPGQKEGFKMTIFADPKFGFQTLLIHLHFLTYEMKSIDIFLSILNLNHMNFSQVKTDTALSDI